MAFRIAWVYFDSHKIHAMWMFKKIECYFVNRKHQTYYLCNICFFQLRVMFEQSNGIYTIIIMVVCLGHGIIHIIMLLGSQT